MKINLELIKSKRIKLNITLKEMSDELGFKNASTYLKYESGAYTFKAEHLPVLSSVLKTPMENFFA